MELVLFLNALRSGLLTFFSSLVIQESLINFAGERLRSKTDSHCESVFYFCLSASYPGVEFVFAEIASTSQPIRTSFFTMLALVWSSGRFLTAKTHIPKLSSKRHRLKPFEVSPHDCKQSLAANLRTVIASERFSSHPVVELGLTGLTSTSRSSRTTCSKSLALLRSSDSVLSVRPRILVIPLQVDS